MPIIQAGAALAAAVSAAEAVGLASGGASVLRAASAVLVRLPEASALARVEADPALAMRQVHAARLLLRRGVPAVRLLDPTREPLVVDGLSVTFWGWLDILPGACSPHALGQLARHLHTATADPPPDTPLADPFTATRRALRSLPGLADLRERLEVLARAWPALIARDPLGSALTHGDLHRDNVARTAGGLVLLDLEDAGVGPPTWDLVAQIVAVRRYGADPGGLRRFLDGYGVAIGGFEGAERLCEAYELMLVVWALEQGSRSARMAEEGAIRLAGFRGESQRRWTLR